MLLRIKDRIINTDFIIEARFTESSSHLILRMVDDGNRNAAHPTSSIAVFAGREGKALWAFLKKEAKEITVLP
jgi:hypothetical protein